MMRTGFAATALLLVAVTLGGPAPSARAAEAPAAAQRLVVYDLVADEADAKVASQLTDALLLHLGARPGMTVLGESEIKVMLAHAKDKEALRDCESDRECLMKLESAIDAEKVITGHLGHLGKTWIVTLKLADAKRATVEHVEAAEAESAAELEVNLRQAADRLLGVADAGARFALAVAPEGTKAAVIDLTPHGVDPAVAENLTQLLSLELKRFEGLSVISRDEIATMLRFQAERQELACTDDTECLVLLGGALGVDYLVNGSVGKLGDSYVITLKLMDVHEAQVVHRASESLRGTEADLGSALRFATWELLGREVTGSGDIEVKANVDEGELVIGEDEPRQYPKGSVLRDFRAGKWGITLRADGYVPLYQETYVFDGKKTLLRLELEESPRAWYEEWWPWAIVGGVVVAGVTAAILVSQSSPDLGRVNVTLDGP